MSHMPYTASEAELLCLSYREPYTKEIHTVKSEKYSWIKDNIFTRMFIAIQNAQIKRAEYMIKHKHYYL